MELLLFEPDIRIPHTDFRLFRVCNNANNWHKKQIFYALKNKMLATYAEPNGYDLQIIKRECHNCNGTGYHYSHRCYCGDGIYETAHVALARFVLNGHLFHQPIGRVNAAGKLWTGGEALQFNETINGLIKHHEFDPVSPDYALWCLQFKYDHATFTDSLKIFSRQMSKQQRKEWGEIASSANGLFDALAKWYKVEMPDELPF